MRDDEADEAAPMSAEASDGGASKTAGGAAVTPGTAVVAGPAPPASRRRRREKVARPHSVFARFSDEEFEVLAVAAALAGVTPTSYVASTAVATARGQVRPLPSGMGDVVRELVEARAQLVRYGVLLNQAVGRLNATGQVDGALLAAAQRCDAATASVRAATERLGRQR